jgi:phosphoenolpyruvate phosphomutase
MLSSGQFVRLAGAHNPLGARVAERAGFDGLWSSSLEVTASLGIPDTGVLTLKDCLSTAASLAASVNIPVIADCDTGFGDLDATAGMVRRFEAANVAGVSIEDQPSPKLNSLADGPHALVPMDEFAAKVRAAKAAQRTPGFVVIARTEALIAGHGVPEALRRAHAYADAGADAILVHSKATSVAPVAEFLSLWNMRVPIVVVPTTYPDATASDLRRLGVQVVIYANHGLRAAVRAMEEAFAAILQDGCTRNLEARMASVKDIFALQQRVTDPATHEPSHEASTIG